MGKTNRVRVNREKRKADPLGGVRNLDIGQNNAIRDGKILPVVKNITSVNANERVEALSAVANLVEDETCRKLLLKERIVPTLMEQSLNDSSSEVVVRAWGALRNLAVEEGYDVCLHMYRKDILTPIAASIAKIQQTIRSLMTDPSSIDNATKKLLWIYAENVVGLLTSLSSETTEEVVTAVINLNIFPFLMGLISPECNAPRQIQSIAAQALNVLTEDQDELVKSIAESEEVFAPLLLGLRDTPVSTPADPLLRTVAVCGIIHNIASILKVSGSVNDVFSDSITLSRLTTLIEVATKASLTSNGSVSSSDASLIESERKEALQCALEIVASITTSLQEDIDGEIPLNGEPAEPNGDPDFLDEDSDAEDGDDEEVAEDDDAVDAAMLDDIEMVTSEDHEPSLGPSDLGSSAEETVTHLIHTIIPLLLPLCQPNAPTAEIQARALNCLNNISWISTTSLPHSSSLYIDFQKQAAQIWTGVISPILRSNTANVELADAVAGLAWAIAKVFSGNVPFSGNTDGETVGGGAEHKGFMSLYNAASTDDLRTKCVGVLGCLGLAEGRIDVNKEIGVFLITLLASLPNTPADPAVEALNAIFDLYADKEFDYDEPVFVRHGFLEHLKAVVPKVRAMAKTVDKRKFPALRLRADEASENLKRFIEYKKKERK